MEAFKTFLTKLNAVNSESPKEIEWLQARAHYEFIDEPEDQQVRYREFVSNLIVSYYELLLAPFIDKKERQSEKITMAFETTVEIQGLLKDIILSDVWKVTDSAHIKTFQKNQVKDLVLIGLLVVVNRYDLFEAFRDILSELSELELHSKKNLLSIYEQLAVKYEASNESKEEVQKEVDLAKIMPLLSFELEDLAKGCQEYQALLADLSNSHHVCDDLVNQETMRVYKVKNEAQAKAFNPKGKATCLLAHGTNDQNILSILEDGIEADPKYVASGSSLGKGAYFAQLTEIGKSAQYSGKYLFIAEVAVGNRYYTSQRNDYRAALLAADSAYDVIHFQGYRYDEVVVFRSEQILVKYLIKL